MPCCFSSFTFIFVLCAHFPVYSPRKTAFFQCFRRFLCTVRMVKTKKVPDRWKDYKPCSWTPIENERIIPFKTPLSWKFDTKSHGDEGLFRTERFTPGDLIKELDERKLHLGMVLDFTFTKRYYDPKELTDNGIIYKKMMCPGHVIPKEQDVKRFENEVHSFLDNNKTGALVGVHCTHGLNRTGYMVCRYLIDCKGYQPEDAIKAFNDSRGYPIERENYLEDLKSRKPGCDKDFKKSEDKLSIDNPTSSSVQRRIDSKEELESEPRECARGYLAPQYSEHRINRKRRFLRENDYGNDFDTQEKYARDDPYHWQRYPERYYSQSFHSNPRRLSRTRPNWDYNYHQRNYNDYNRIMDFQRGFEPYHSGYHVNNSELNWYESDYWNRNDTYNFDPRRCRYRY